MTPHRLLPPLLLLLAALLWSLGGLANAALQASLLAMQQVLGHLHTKGTIVGVEDKIMMFKERQEALNAKKYQDLEKRYVVKS